MISFTGDGKVDAYNILDMLVTIAPNATFTADAASLGLVTFAPT